MKTFYWVTKTHTFSFFIYATLVGEKKYLNKLSTYSNRRLCVCSSLADCPAGTKYDGVSTCEDCPLHSYQDQPAQTRCKPCPKDYVTESDRAVGISQCKG